MRFDDYRLRAEQLLKLLGRTGEKMRSGAAEHDKRTPAQVAMRLIASNVLSDKDRADVRTKCIEFASKIADGPKRRRALELFAYVLGDSGRRVLREGEVAISRHEWRRVEALAADVAIDSLILVGELESGSQLSPLASDDNYWRAQLAEDVEALA